MNLDFTKEYSSRTDAGFNCPRCNHYIVPWRLDRMVDYVDCPSCPAFFCLDGDFIHIISATFHEEPYAYHAAIDISYDKESGEISIFRSMRDFALPYNYINKDVLQEIEKLLLL